MIIVIELVSRMVMNTDSGTTKGYVRTAVVCQVCCLRLVTKEIITNCTRREHLYKRVTALESNGIPIVNQSGQVSFK